jgi:acetylornithine deacetylase/succinyl-diaminopimelate desuccinylase-like protein
VTAAEILQRLVRFETVNPPGGERECIAWIEGLLREAGLETRIVAKDPERPNLVARRPGRGEAPPLLLQGHVDVVPVSGQQWSRPPFSGEVHDGFVWGRGTLDMKGGVAMMLRALLDASEPAGDVLLCAMSDEEAGSDLGAAWLVSEHAELFDGVRYALGEFGGFTLHAGGRRFYPVQVAEKQVCWLRGRITGPAGHGSMPMRGGTLGKLGDALRRLDRGRLPVHVTPVPRRTIETMAGALGGPQGVVLRALLVPRLTDRLLDVLGERGTMLDPLLHNTVNATVVRAGDKVNVIPGEAELRLDGRLLPGFSPDEFVAEVRALAGDGLDLEVDRHDTSGAPEPDLGLWDVLADALREGDPDAIPVPQLLPAVTDGRFFARLGIQTYGFTPMRLPEGFEFRSLIHAADERIPVDAVEFGAAAIGRVLERYRG